MYQSNRPSQIQFDTDQVRRSRPSVKTAPRIVALVIKYSGGYIKTERQANYVIVALVVVAIAFSLMVSMGSQYEENIIPSMPAADVSNVGL